ncbi:MAG TPA: diacylglycerol kinase family protein [Chitinophagaceae bacterium]|nr:diacylglycerol kinase family protein [Chitinophagaceae bacterium]
MDNDIQGFSLQARIKSFSYSFAGIKQLLRYEHNARIHIAFTVFTVMLCFVFNLRGMEIIALTIVIAMVWMAELFNTCLEKTIDFISVEKLPALKRIKDMAAAAVLISAICAVITGCIIFIPKLLSA